MSRISNLGLWILAGFILPVAAFAEEAMAAPSPWIAPAVGFGIGIAVFAAAFAQGKIASAFMEGASRNPGAVNVMRTPLILSLIFVETLVLFTVLIVLMLVGRM